ncbi:hypothetical protein ACJX0J_030779, partial [Zea mays]
MYFWVAHEQRDENLERKKKSHVILLNISSFMFALPNFISLYSITSNNCNGQDMGIITCNVMVIGMHNFSAGVVPSDIKVPFQPRGVYFFAQYGEEMPIDPMHEVELFILTLLIL